MFSELVFALLHPILFELINFYQQDFIIRHQIWRYKSPGDSGITALAKTCRTTGY